MKTLAPRLVRVAIATSLLITLVVPPAFAVGRPSVPNNATVGGVSLYGLTEAQAAAAITANAPKLVAKPVNILIGKGTKRTLDPAKVTTIDVETMLAEAYASRADTATAFELAPKYLVSSAAITKWLAPTAKKINKKPVTAARWVSKRVLKVRKSAYGYRTETKAGTANITVAVKRSIATTSVAQKTTVKVTLLKPKVTTAKLGKAIVVVLGKRRVTLYKAGSTRKEISYPCAVGMSRYPTPRGTWKIVDKNPHPSWTNPGSAWAHNMPSYIPPGPSNPLGLRALYLNAPGIRIHGTSNYSSIGTAASHGCIRLRNSDVVKFYPRVPVGTTVYIVK